VIAKTAPVRLELETISNEQSFAALEGSWDDLVREMPRPSPVLLHGWLRTWWRHFGDGELTVHVAYRDSKLVGALPLCVLRRRGLRVLTFLGGEQVALADLLLAKDENVAVGRALGERAVSSEYDYADLHGLPSPSRLGAALGPSNLRLIVRAEAPVLELNGEDWDAVYRSRLSSNQRHLHRRRTRQLSRLGKLETTVARTPDELESALEDAFTLHGLRWQGRPDGSDFGTPTGRQFHREAIIALAEQDVPRIVTLKLDDRPIAFVYYFAFEQRMYCHRLAFDPELYRFSPGVVNRFAALDTAFAEGAIRVEFFGGMERYKMDLADRLEPLHEGIGLARGVSGRAAVAARLTAIRLRRTLKRSPALHRFYYEGLGPVRRALGAMGRT
jgi:CelD/BcsL family acetyltransferase involved in cellulose biosynthesis